MDELSYSDIPIRHRCRLKGKYARGFDRCPHCDHRHDDLDVDEDHWIGVAEWSADGIPVKSGIVVVRECESCFQYFYHHCSPSYYQNFVRGDIYEVRRNNESDE